MKKNKLQRFRELDTFPNAIPFFYADFVNRNFRLKGSWSAEIFKNNNPITLELGCGKGEYSFNLAREFPARNFIGVDVKGNRMWVGARKGLEENLGNLFFLRTRIDFIEEIFGPGEVSEIWITFPDPQKERPRKRLTHPLFLNRYKKILRNGGAIHLKTDSAILYEYTLGIIEKLNLEIKDFSFYIYNDTRRRPWVEDIKTFYESIYLSEGVPIKFISFSLDRLPAQNPAED